MVKKTKQEQRIQYLEDSMIEVIDIFKNLDDRIHGNRVGIHRIVLVLLNNLPKKQLDKEIVFEGRKTNVTLRDFLDCIIT